MHPLLTDVYSTLLHVLLPVRCVVCKKEATSAVCINCLTHMAPAKEQQCPTCHKPSIAGLTHLPCMRTDTLDQLLSMYDYKDPNVSELIIVGKYKFIPDAFQEIAPHLSRFAQNCMDIEADMLVTSLPLHRSRERWRGFNQARILAQNLAKNLSLKYTELLIRNRYTRTQKDLKREARLANVAGCFSLANEIDIRRKVIVLVDDVTTSGSTLQAAAKILKLYGARSVIALTLARD